MHKMTDKEKFEYMCRLYYDTVTDGTDNIDEAFSFMMSENIIDSDGEWIYENE